MDIIRGMSSAPVRTLARLLSRIAGAVSLLAPALALSLAVTPVVPAQEAETPSASAGQTDEEFIANEAQDAAQRAAVPQAAPGEPGPGSVATDAAASTVAAPQGLPAVGATTKSAAAVAVDEEPAVLRVWHRPIAVFRASYQGISPAERAALAAQRIEDLPGEFLGEPVTTAHAEVNGHSGMLVMVKDRMLFGLLEQDVNALGGETLDLAAIAAAARLEEVFSDQQEQLSVASLIRGCIVALSASLIFGAVMYFGLRLRHRIFHTVEKQVLPKLPSPFGLDLRAGILAVEESIVRLTSWSAAAIVTYLWLTFVLKQFAYSRPGGDELGNYIAGVVTELATGAVGAVPGLFTVALILLGTRLVVQGLSSFFISIERGRMKVGWLPAETARATRRILSVLIWLFALTVAYPYMPGSGSTAFKGVSVFAGVMLSFGSVGFVNQVMSGLVLVYSRALRIGDVVTINGIAGVVSEVGILSTKLRTPRREEVTIPNAVVATTNVVNHTRLAGSDGAVVATSVSIGYDTPWRQVHGLLKLAAGRTDKVNDEQPPVILQKSLSDFYVEYELRVRIERPLDRFQVLSDLNAQILDAFNEHGVQIMSPHFKEQPVRPVVVPRGAWHAAPAEPPQDAPA
jgi:small-conductance mechanosensitive channel